MINIKIIAFFTLILGVNSIFYTGRIMYGKNEYPELSGRMRVREAVVKCETDPECAGFTFMGSPELQTVRHVAFFRFVDEITTRLYRDVDWMSYHVDREIATYVDQVPEQGVYTEFENSEWTPGQRLKDYLLSNNGSAVAFSGDGRVRFFDQVDLATMKRSRGEWSTYFNLNSNDANVVGLNRKNDIDFCCPKYEIKQLPILNTVRRRGHIARVPCNISREEFTERFIRPMQPCVLTDCDYGWLERNRDLSVASVAKLFHDNNTSPNLDFFLEPLPGFTHIRTPNSHEESDEQIMDALEYGYLRVFNRMRYNYNCQSRNNSDCRLFENFLQPPPIPDDLYVETKFENDLDWVIVSQQNTGSHPHNDPDLTGAWNYLINGYKWWVIFPNGMDAKYINCKDECSPDISDHSETYRWFHHVLPQIRDIPVYGGKPIEFVQGPREAVYLPHGVAHSVLNLRDNVAVTENFLFVDALPELMSKIVLDEISTFRPGWDEQAIKKLYYKLVSAKDRAAMRRMYDHAVLRVTRDPQLCDDAEKARNEKLENIFGKRKPEMVRYSSLPGATEPPKRGSVLVPEEARIAVLESGNRTKGMRARAY